MKKNKRKRISGKTLRNSSDSNQLVSEQVVNKPPIGFLLAVFLISASSLAFEIAVTRVSSVVFAYNYVFLIVSLAIMGLGSGAILAVYKWQRNRIGILNELPVTLSFYGSLFALSLILFIIFITSVPFFTVSFGFFIISFIPFFFVGLIMAIIFRAFPKYSFRIYAFDLLGASAGAVLVIFAFNYFGGINIIFFISFLGLASAGLFLIKNRKKSATNKKLYRIISIAVFCVILFSTNSIFGYIGEIPVRNEQNKEMAYFLNNSDSRIVETRWSAFGRVDLLSSPTDDELMRMFIDGAAGTAMFKFNGDIENIDYIEKNLEFIGKNLAGAFPFMFLNNNEKDNMLVIGPGGGWEIMLGLINGVKKIYGVEVNRDFIEIVKEYRDYNGGIYTDFENVDIIASEGRDYIRNTDERFDIIMISIPVTKSSRSVEGYALTENYLLTTESINDYYNHLTDEGRMILVLHNQVEVMSFITTSLETFKDMGIKSSAAMDHIYTVGKGMSPIIILKKNPFTVEESEDRYALMHTLNLDSSQPYLPHIEQEVYAMEHADGSTMNHYVFNNFLIELSRGDISLEKLIENSSYDLSPTSDNRPFFFDNISGVSNNLAVLFFIVLLFNFSATIAPLKILNIKKGFPRLTVVFLLLGAGFMLIEISFFQKLTFYMGSPTISLALILSTLLIGMGIGSFSSRKIFKEYSAKRLVFSSLLVFALSISFFFTTPIIMDNLPLTGIVGKSFAASIILIPLGFILGIPFPTALNIASETGFEHVIPYYYGINGTMSVLGAVIAMIISTTFGFSYSLVTGAIFYLLIALSFLSGIKK